MMGKGKNYCSFSLIKLQESEKKIKGVERKIKPECQCFFIDTYIHSYYIYKLEKT